MRSRHAAATIASALALLATGSATARAAAVPANADWSQAYITEADGTKLHADILRPKGIPAAQKTPVILSIGPYFNHSGQTGPAGPVEGTTFDPTGPAGPSDRFLDFVNGAHLMDKGYTFVMVDLRGFGGSSGCLDWVGPGEQADVRSAVEWAAGQPWSTGKVGMYGKSYDGVTGLVGAVEQPAGLAAVVAQEPVYDLYRYLYANGVRFVNSLATPALYDMIAETPGTVQDDPTYNLNGASQSPDCPVTNYLGQAANSDHSSAFWAQRDLIAKVNASPVPLFMTQGFIEDNTKPDGAFDFFNRMAGPKRAWFGMWDHVRGNDTTASGRLKMGRAGWFDEVMRFYDHYVKDVPLADAPTDQDPPVAVETSDGTWRSEQSWPPADSTPTTTALRAGTYTDDGTNNGTAEGGSPNGQGVWTISPPLPYEAHLAGVPKATVDVSTLLPDANLVVDVYDIDTADNAILVSRNASLIPKSGAVSLDLYGDDWVLKTGHRIGVLVTGANAEWWTHTPTLQTVTVSGGSISLPFLAHTRPATIQGDPSVKLESYKADAPFAVPAATIASSTAPGFGVPPEQTPAP
jgi:predicted acyl esterase